MALDDVAKKLGKRAKEAIKKVSQGSIREVPILSGYVIDDTVDRATARAALKKGFKKIEADIRKFINGESESSQWHEALEEIEQARYDIEQNADWVIYKDMPF